MHHTRSGLQSPVFRLIRDAVLSREENWKLESAELFAITYCVLGAKWSIRRSGYRIFFVLICVFVRNRRISAA